MKKTMDTSKMRQTLDKAKNNLKYIEDSEKLKEYLMSGKFKNPSYSLTSEKNINSEFFLSITMENELSTKLNELGISYMELMVEAIDEYIERKTDEIVGLSKGMQKVTDAEEVCEDSTSLPCAEWDCTETPSYFVFGRWDACGTSYLYPFYVERDGCVYLRKFSNKKDALEFISTKVEENGNIDWCITKTSNIQPINPKMQQSLNFWVVNDDIEGWEFFHHKPTRRKQLPPGNPKNSEWSGNKVTKEELPQELRSMYTKYFDLDNFDKEPIMINISAIKFSNDETKYC